MAQKRCKYNAKNNVKRMQKGPLKRIVLLISKVMYLSCIVLVYHDMDM